MDKDGENEMLKLGLWLLLGDLLILKLTLMDGLSDTETEGDELGDWLDDGDLEMLKL